MKEKYPLPILLRRMKLSRSSYYYQIKAFAVEDKYEYLRHEIVRIFLENKARYGYRSELLLSDIREFAIPAGKVYLSPAVDCFDGMLVTWRISGHPNADLVNGMLDDVIANIGTKSKPIIHTDRGCHYRWPGWIERMKIKGYTRSMSHCSFCEALLVQRCKQMVMEITVHGAKN